jgi:hypothetical protein
MLAAGPYFLPLRLELASALGRQKNGQPFRFSPDSTVVIANFFIPVQLNRDLMMPGTMCLSDSRGRATIIGLFWGGVLGGQKRIVSPTDGRHPPRKKSSKPTQQLSSTFYHSLSV